jgi:hypothetical protein
MQLREGVAILLMLLVVSVAACKSAAHREVSGTIEARRSNGERKKSPVRGRQAITGDVTHRQLANGAAGNL